MTFLQSTYLPHLIVTLRFIMAFIMNPLYKAKFNDVIKDSI